MRHHDKQRKFGLESGPRAALMRSLIRSLVIHGKIKTTAPKAKSLRPMIEKLITRAKSPTLANRRLLISRFANDEGAVAKLIETAAKFPSRQGGYTRIVKLDQRKSDGAPMAVIEFV